VKKPAKQFVVFRNHFDGFKGQANDNYSGSGILRTYAPVNRAKRNAKLFSPLISTDLFIAKHVKTLFCPDETQILHQEIERAS